MCADPTDSCIQHNTSNLDCFTDGIIQARRTVPGQTFLITEFNCGLGSPCAGVAYAAAFLLRTVNALRTHAISALSWWCVLHHSATIARDNDTIPMSD